MQKICRKKIKSGLLYSCEFDIIFYRKGRGGYAKYAVNAQCPSFFPLRQSGNKNYCALCGFSASFAVSFYMKISQFYIELMLYSVREKLKNFVWFHS